MTCDNLGNNWGSILDMEVTYTGENYSIGDTKIEQGDTLRSILEKLIGFHSNEANSVIEDILDLNSEITSEELDVLFPDAPVGFKVMNSELGLKFKKLENYWVRTAFVKI